MSSLPDLEAGLPQVRGQEVGSPFLVGVEEGYERWAPTYDHFPNPLLNREERYLAPLLPTLEGKRALDVACGTGRWLQHLLMRGAQLAVGVDVSAAMLQVAGRKAAIRGRLLRADCLRLPFRPSAFDFAICSFVLSHIGELRSIACELARVMSPNSELLITDLHPEGHARGWRTGFRDGQSAVEIEAFPRSAESMVRAFHAAGFECLMHVALCLGEAEKAIFRQGGKSPLFAEACRVPAVLICRFIRRGRAIVPLGVS